MAEEAATPLPSIAVRHQRAPMATRLQPPTSPFFVGSNDDQLERALSRAARAAALRRKATAPPPPAGPGLSNEQIVELFQNCIKLASENVCTLSSNLRFDFLLPFLTRLGKCALDFPPLFSPGFALEYAVQCCILFIDYNVMYKPPEKFLSAYIFLASK